MILKDALGFVIDYGKFIATLWNGYVVFTGVVIGWLVSMRSKEGPIDRRLRKILVGGYLVASAVFGIALAYNEVYLFELHAMLHKIADAKPNDPAVIAYNTTLGRHSLAISLGVTFAMFIVVALLAAWVMWFISGIEVQRQPSTDPAAPKKS